MTHLEVNDQHRLPTFVITEGSAPGTVADGSGVHLLLEVDENLGISAIVIQSADSRTQNALNSSDLYPHLVITNRLPMSSQCSALSTPSLNYR